MFSTKAAIKPVLVIFLTVFSIIGAAAADEIKRETTTAVEAVRPALIRILIVAADYRQGREMKAESAGSGVIVSPEGYAVTNHHVAMDAERIVCTLADKREVEATLVGTDPLADIAVIKLQSPDKKPFPFASFGDSSKLGVGDRVFAMGCPLALSQSVTMGIVSNTEMIMPGFFGGNDFQLEGEDVGSIVRWIGHDALIRPGNSGGPLVDRDGKIVGINEISYGLSGAIPSNLAKEVAGQLIKTGKVTRSWLGLEVQPLLESSGLERGVLIGGVMDDSPAKKSGFKSGDVLLSLDGKNVTAKFKEEVPLFNQFVADIPIGKTVKAIVLRDGKEITLNVTTVERQRAIGRQDELKNWGICASDITYMMSKEMQLDSQEGTVVTGVLPSGPAGSAKPSIREEDVIVGVGNEKISNVDQLRSLTRKILEGADGIVPVIVNFNRGKKQYATVVKIGKKESSKSGVEARKAWLPIDMQVLTDDLAQALGVTGKTGVRVTQVYPASSAEKAGLKVGDLILKLDDEVIPADQPGDEEVLPSMVRQYDIGAQVKLGIVRDGQPMEIMVDLETSPKLPRDYPKYEDENFEFSARDIAFADKTEGSVISDNSGVYVESVTEGSWAALGNLQPGDVIAEINGKKLSGLAELELAMKRIAEEKPKRVVFKVLRGIHALFVEIEPGWQAF
ncbi:MAG: PDZ domain-containing protein [Armatimonadota bacterium]|nr:PDZ domain-containing protein [bacterium]